MKITSWLSKGLKTMVALALAATAFASVDTAKAVSAVTISYANTVGHLIEFDGAHHFNFTPGNNFVVTSATLGASAGSLGEIFSAGVGFTMAAPVDHGGGFFTSEVSGTGTFTIHGPGGFDLTGDLEWVRLTQIFGGNGLNLEGVVNLTNISYAGADPGLLALANAGSGANTLTFSFTPVVSLPDLYEGAGAHSTSFSGTLASVPDGGTTVALLGFVLAGMEGLRRRLRMAK